jgi:hypothetical protein
MKKQYITTLAKQVGSDGDTSYFYSGSVWFESQPSHWLPSVQEDGGILVLP